MSRVLRRRYGRAKIPRVGGNDPRNMTAGEINKELDKLDVLSSKINSEMIEAGRGHETWAETARMDPTTANDLTLAWQTVAERRSDLRRQVERRYGPGAPSRLPKGFGPIKGAR